MNINQRISELGPGGLPRYNRKCNELTKAVNWLLGMTTSNGKVISDGGRGPIINAGGPAAGAQPSAADPDGNPAGWLKITHLDLDGSITGFTNSMYQLWTWVGIPKNITSLPIPWMVDPSNNQAGWIVCADNSFWGTGQCSTGQTCSNYQTSGYSGSDQGPSPLILTFHAAAQPIVPPSNCTPRFTLLAAPQYGVASGGGAGPSFGITNGLSSTGAQTDTLTWSFTVTYDGLTVISVSRSDPVVYGQTLWVTLNPAGWLWDPSGIPGYGHGSGYWVYPFNGAPSQNTNPLIVETFTFSYVSGINYAGYIFGAYPPGNGVVFMTG